MLRASRRNIAQARLHFRTRVDYPYGACRRHSAAKSPAQGTETSIRPVFMGSSNPGLYRGRKVQSMVLAKRRSPAAWRCWRRCAGPRRVPLWLAWATPYHRLRACYIFSAVRDHILSEIRRLAGANGGRPPGRRSFAKRTGIRESAWFGIYWPRWGDALIEAGFTPNTPPERLDEGHVFSKLAAACRHFGRFPVTKEMRMYKKVDADFPNEKSVISGLETWLL